MIECPWPGCGRKCKSEQGLAAHVFQKHDIQQYRDKGMSIKVIIEARRKANQIIAERKRASETPNVHEKAGGNVHENRSVKPSGPPKPPEAIKIIKPDKEQIKKEEKDKRKEAKERAKAEKNAPREKLWSETHPGGWKSARNILPRMHMVAFALFLAYLTIMELIAGNYDFMNDWWEASWIGPAFLEVTASETTIQLWWQYYGPEFMIVMIFLFMCVVVCYLCVWRAWFKNYIKYSEGEPKPEGRCYWRTNNMWTRAWDRAYGSPPRTMNTYWINQGKIFNIFNPNSSLIRLDTGLDEECEEKGLWKIQVNEKRIRRKVNNSSKWLTTANELFDNGVIPTDYVEDLFLIMTEKCVKDTKKLTHANPDVRVDVVKSGTSLVLPEWKEAVLNARRKRAERDQVQTDH